MTAGLPASFDPERFVAAQDRVMPAVLAELRAGRKQSHWMWFVFPQLTGLGRSPTARFYGLNSLEDARAYFAHEALGPRLVACVDLVNAVEGWSAHTIFSSPDDLKFHSSMTLFTLAAPDEVRFRTALDRYFDGVPDSNTLVLSS